MRRDTKKIVAVAFAFAMFAVFTLYSAALLYRGSSRYVLWINLGIGILGILVTMRQLLPRVRGFIGPEGSNQG